MMQDLGSYSWVNEWESLGFCVAVVDLADPEELLRRVVRLSVTDVMPQPQVQQWVASRYASPSDYVAAVEATSLGAWSLCLELNGFEATIAGSPERLSAGRHRAAIVYRSVNADMQFIWAVDGQIVRSFDPLLYGSGGIGAALEEESTLPFGSGAAMASAFALAESLTGVRLTPSLLDERGAWLAIGHRPSWQVPG